ncbi:MAG: hypothetical protein Q9227_002897 [Pyrenula ochraceoflavens]
MSAAQTAYLNLAEETYKNAVSLFNSKYTSSHDKKKWLSNKDSLQDVEDALLEAKARYDSRTSSRARQQINRVSAGLMYYANIMDMLVQHHPEYVSLGWGTMKLTFVLVLNHEELVTELSKALANVCNTLPRTQLHLVLYPSERMKRAVEELYALLICFYQRALRWYEKNRLKHVVQALIRPFRLAFGDLVERINSQARAIESLAITMAHQEIRSIYVLVQECMSEQKHLGLNHRNVERRVNDVQQVQDQTLKLLVNMQQMLICRFQANEVSQKLTDAAHQSVNSGLLLNTQRMTRETQVALMIAAASASELLSPKESLRRRLALCSQRRVNSSLDLNDVLRSPAFRSWLLRAESSLLIVSDNMSMRSESRVAGTYLTELIKSSTAPILWALQGPNRRECPESTSDLLKYLTMQALQIDPNKVGENVSQNFNAALVASASSEDDWIRVLKNIMTSLPGLFIVIEADALRSSGRDEAHVLEFLRLLHTFVLKNTSPPVKIAFFSHRKVRLPPHETSPSKDNRTHNLSLHKVVQASAAPRKVVNVRSALRRQQASKFQRQARVYAPKAVSVPD